MFLTSVAIVLCSVHRDIKPFPIRLRRCLCIELTCIITSGGVIPAWHDTSENRRAVVRIGYVQKVVPRMFVATDKPKIIKSFIDIFIVYTGRCNLVWGILNGGVKSKIGMLFCGARERKAGKEEYLTNTIGSAIVTPQFHASRDVWKEVRTVDS